MEILAIGSRMGGPRSVAIRVINSTSRRVPPKMITLVFFISRLRQRRALARSSSVSFSAPFNSERPGSDPD
jgi:hypothetical protein